MALVDLVCVLQIAKDVGHPHIPVMCCALGISASMALPFSSFPNMNSLLVKVVAEIVCVDQSLTCVSLQDDLHRPYLGVKDFLRVGLPFSFISIALICTFGYWLVIVVVGWHKPTFH